MKIALGIATGLLIGISLAAAITLAIVAIDATGQKPPPVDTEFERSVNLHAATAD